jgi:hypothetical protein
VFSTPERHWETQPLMKMGDFDVCNKKNPILPSSQELSFKCWDNLVITPAHC